MLWPINRWKIWKDSHAQLPYILSHIRFQKVTLSRNLLAYTTSIPTNRIQKQPGCRGCFKFKRATIFYMDLNNEIGKADQTNGRGKSGSTYTSVLQLQSANGECGAGLPGLSMLDIRSEKRMLCKLIKVQGRTNQFSNKISQFIARGTTELQDHTQRDLWN